MINRMKPKKTVAVAVAVTMKQTVKMILMVMMMMMINHLAEGCGGKTKDLIL